MDIHYDESRCGSGKTLNVLQDMATRPGRYIYAVDRRDQIADRSAALGGFAKAANTTPIIMRIASEDGGKFSENVARRIEALPRDYATQVHVIAIITHEGMKSADHSKFAGWEIIIDEDPGFLELVSWNVAAGKALLERYYELSPVGNGVSSIRPKPNTVSAGDIESDDLCQDLLKLHRRAQIGSAYCTLTSWADLSNSKKPKFAWWSMWDPTKLESYDRVSILANNFSKKLSFEVLTHTFANRITLVRLPGPPLRPYLTRDVKIEYFSSTHAASRSVWTANEEGRAVLHLIEKHVYENASSEHLWCANLYEGAFASRGNKVTPKVAGTNRFKAVRDCTVIYSAKASTCEAKMLKAIFGSKVSRQHILADRETEDLIQIVMRTSLRDPNNPDPVTLRVYDRTQAEALENYLVGAGYGFNVMLEHVNVGADQIKIRSVGRPKSDKPPVPGDQRTRKWREGKAAKTAKAAVLGNSRDA